MHAPMPVLSGSHSHGMALLFRMTVLTPIIVPIAQKPSHGSQRKNAEARSGVPLCLGLSFAGTGFRSFLFPVSEDVLHRFLNHSSQHCFDKGHGFLL